MIRVAVVDDEKECLERIGGYLDRLSEYQTERFLTTSAEELLEKHGAGVKSDLVFLDIEMGSMTGIDAAKQISEGGSGPLIIFTTAHSQYVKEAFYVNAFQYMFKPIEFEDFRYEFERAANAVQRRNRTFEVSHGHEKVLLKCSDIFCIETRDRHLVVKTADREYLYNGALKEAERQLSGYGFSKAEQGILVNLGHVRKLEPTQVELDNGERKFVSRRMYKAFLADLNVYLSRNQ